MHTNRNVQFVFRAVVFSFFLLFLCTQPRAQQTQQTFLLFWRSDCGSCELAIKQLVAKCKTLNKNFFTITTISFDTDSTSYFNAIKNNNMEGFDNQYNFKEGYTNNPLAKKYGVTKTPTLLQLDRQGNVIAQGQAAFISLSNLPKL
jgi:thioredoxin-related protein